MPGSCAPSAARQICSSSTIRARSPSRPTKRAICSKSSRTVTAEARSIITSQLPVDRWHDLIGIPTLADAILDRVIHNAYRIELAGESLRRTRGKQLKTA